MAKAPGRLAILAKNAVAIAGVKVTTIGIDNEPIDVSDRDSNGVVEVLAQAKSRQLKLSVSGIHSTPVLRDLSMNLANSPLITDLTFKFADALAAADTVTGNFFLINYEEENPDDDAAKFKAEFSSSGAWTLT